MTGEAGDSKTDGAGGQGKRPDHLTPTPEQLRARNRRNIAIAVAVAAFAVFFYVITIAKLGVGILNRPL